MAAFTPRYNDATLLEPWTAVVGPSITSFAPASQYNGYPLTITGTGFTGLTNVRFNGVSAMFILNSDTSITATVPAGNTALLNGPITVEIGAAVATSPTPFVLNTGTGAVVNVLMISNSIGAGSNGAANSPLAQAQNLSPANYTFTNNSLSGKGIDWFESRVAQDVDPFYDPTPGVVNILVYLEGTNSRQPPPPAAPLTPSAYFDRMQAYLEQQRAKGWKIMALTVPPQSVAIGGALGTGGFNDWAHSVNDAMRNPQQGGTFIDCLIDLALNAKVGRENPSSADNPDWYPDGKHFAPINDTITGRMIYDGDNFLAMGTPLPNPAYYPPASAVAQPLLFQNFNNVALFGTSSYRQTGGASYQANAGPSTVGFTDGVGLRGVIRYTSDGGAAGFIGIFSGAWAPTGYAYLDFGLLNQEYMYEAPNSFMQNTDPYGAGDVFEIHVYGNAGAPGDPVGKVIYKNSRLLFTSSVPTIFPCRAGLSMEGGSLNRAMLDCAITVY